MTTLPKLNSRRLVEQAVEALRDQIMSGVYGPDGELPPQGDLCLELGVSRSVIREAMQQLQSQRLVVIAQGRKPRVLPAGPQAMADSLHVLMRRTDASLLQLAEVRRPLEAEIAALAAERITPSDISRLEDANQVMRSATDVADQVEADMRFHRVLAEAAGNPIFVFLLDALAELLRASRRKTIGHGGVGPALAGHEQVLAAVRKRNPTAARRAMQAHLQAAKCDLQREE